MAVRTSQSVVEVVVLPDNQNALISQSVVEVILPVTPPTNALISQLPIEVIVLPDNQIAFVSQTVVEAIIHPPLALLVSCLVTIPVQGSIAAQYFVLLRDVDGNLVAVFDDWISLSFREIIKEVYEGTFTISGVDTRTTLFEEDARLEIYRSVPGASIIWYIECTLLIDGFVYDTAESGEKLFIVELVGLNDFIRRRDVAYRAGTIFSDKSAAADSVIQEYVNENTGIIATTGNGRLEEGIIPNFTVAGATGAAKIWRGSLSGQNLLSSIQDIAKFATIDFAVVQSGDDSWIFTVYPNLIGNDRTAAGLNASTGLNLAGNAPVYFSVPFGTVANQNYRKSRRNEANTIIVWGNGERSTQKVAVRKDVTQRAITKYNKRELSVSGSNAEYTYQLEFIGDAELEINKFEETFQMIPLQQVSNIYGKHYFLGDRVTVIDERTQTQFTKRIIGVTFIIDGQTRNEQLTFEFE